MKDSITILKITQMVLIIELNMKNNNKLEESLEDVIKIASILGHQHVIEWANQELIGYDNIELVPNYRYIECYSKTKKRSWVKKNLSHILVLIPWIYPIAYTIRSIQNISSTHNIFDQSGNPIDVYVQGNDIEKVISGVKAKIIEYTSKVISNPENLKIEFKTRNEENSEKYKQNLENLSDEISILKSNKILRNDEESKIFFNNMKCLYEFKRNLNFKYSIIAMGSLIEFLLIRYCQNHNLSPEKFNGKKGYYFSHYLETAIKRNLFNEKKRWEIVQRYLRGFRNYIHIDKEIKSIKIDYGWYKTLAPIFERLYECFKNEIKI